MATTSCSCTTRSAASCSTVCPTNSAARHTCRPPNTSSRHEPDRVADLAYHFDAAGDSPQALPYALQAAEQAKSQGALEAAEQQYRMAERGAARAPRSIQYRIAEGLGNVAMLRGHYDAAEVLFEQAATLAEGRFAESQVLGMLGELSRQRGDMGQAVQRIEKALKTLGYRVPRAMAACVLRSLGGSGPVSALLRARPVRTPTAQKTE